MIAELVPGTLQLPRDYTRSEGVHLSSIIRCLATDAGILSNEQAEELSLTDVRHITDPVALLRISMGLAWEEWYLSKVLPLEGVSKHPGEMQLGGVYMTPDGVDTIVLEQGTLTSKKGRGSVTRYTQRIHECKCTYKSTNTVGETVEDLQKNWMWMAQMMGYCAAANTNRAKLHVLFVCGDYKFPISPQLKVWDITFSQEELEQNWNMMEEGKAYYGATSQHS